MEKLSLILSIIASIGTIISIMFTVKVNKKLNTVNQVKGRGNIQSKGSNSINNTGNNNTINK
ncbi:hypothetical protein ACM1RC_21415 [Paenibacillus azoreducens]|uniref:hypothetical protein n=1 Tax=Paenibacillus azoreducens TaxID=116718 RepID=UPI0039F6177B